MQEERKMSAENLVNLVIGLVGVVLVFLGVAYIKKLNFSTITISVGASLIASSIVAYLSSIYIQKYRRAKEISEIWGIYSMADKRATMNISIDQSMKKAKHHYDLIAYGLKSLRDGNSQGVLELLDRGAAIRIITVDPSVDALNERDEQEGKQTGSTALSIHQLKEWTETLNSKYPDKVQIRFARFLPSEFYCRVDDSIFVGPYQYGKESQQDITVEYRKPGKAFAYYEEYFESLWNNNEYCHKSPESG